MRSILIERLLEHLFEVGIMRGDLDMEIMEMLELSEQINMERGFIIV
jgi:hypothetical protein